MSTDFAMPDLGEGLTESELVAWHVAVGELVELNQPIAEIETAKAIVQLPSPFAGTISQLYAEPGTTVAVGARLVAFDLTDEADAPVERNSVLVGYGPEVESGDASPSVVGARLGTVVVEWRRRSRSQRSSSAGASRTRYRDLRREPDPPAHHPTRPQVRRRPRRRPRDRHADRR